MSKDDDFSAFVSGQIVPLAGRQAPPMQFAMGEDDKMKHQLGESEPVITPEQALEGAGDPLASEFMNPMPGVPRAAGGVPTMAKPPEGAFKGQPRPQYKDYGEDRNSDFTRDLNSFKKYGAYGLPAKKAWTMGELMKMRDAVIQGKTARQIKEMFPDRTEAAIRFQVKNNLGGFSKQGPPGPGVRVQKMRQREKDELLMQQYLEILKKRQGEQSFNIHPSVQEWIDAPQQQAAGSDQPDPEQDQGDLAEG